MVFIQRRWHADDDGIHAGDLGVVGGGAEARFLRRQNFCGENAHDIRSATVERGDLTRVDIEAFYLEAFAAEQQCQR